VIEAVQGAKVLKAKSKAPFIAISLPKSYRKRLSASLTTVQDSSCMINKLYSSFELARTIATGHKIFDMKHHLKLNIVLWLCYFTLCMAHQNIV